MKAVASEEGAALVVFNEAKYVDGIPVSRYVFDTDLFISVPKFKTHCVTTITGAVKNVYGTVVGLYKAQQHSHSPKEEEFARVIAKVYAAAKPGLTVMDAVVAMEGDGPSGGTPRPVGLIMAGTDAVALDSCAARVIGLRPFDVLTTKEAHMRKLGEGDPERIDIVGEEIDGFILKDFSMPQTALFKALPNPVLKFFAGLIRFMPVIDASRCRRCGLCKESCPVRAITITKEICKINHRICVKCLCCHELCPYRAIDMRRNLLARMLWG
jgi:ferredoxin